MNIPMRRLLATTITLFAVGLTALCVQWVHNRLGDEATLTGWTLLVSTAGLYLLSVRKKWIQLRLGRVSAWLQVHAYMGSFASVVFLMHIGWPLRGPFEIGLAGCFAIVAGTGVVLGVMSRTTPRRLASLPVDYQLERIPVIRATVAQDAHRLALSSTQLGEGATLAEYYQRRLLPFFHAPRGLFYRLLPNGLLRRQLLRELDDLERYLAEPGNTSRSALANMVRAKDDLDYQHALQTRLRILFAAHTALVWVLAMLIALHVMLVYRFQGGVL